MKKEENISAFAYEIGKDIERIIEERNGGLTKQLEKIQASIFNFRREIKGNSNMLKVYDLYFGIETVDNGKI